MQSEFFQTYGRKVTLCSSRILFTSFHPIYGDGAHMLMLEELFQPDYLQIKNVEPSPDYIERLEQYSKAAAEIFETAQIQEQQNKEKELNQDQNLMPEEEYKSRGSFMSNIDGIDGGVQIVLPNQQVQEIVHVVEKAIPVIEQEYADLSLKNKFAKAIGLKLRKMVEDRMKRAETQKKLLEYNVSVGSDRRSTNKGGERVFSRPYKLYVTNDIENDISITRVRVSIWKLDPIMENVRLYSQDLIFESQYGILEDSLYFSNNGEYIYFLLYNKNFHELEKAIILRSCDLLQEGEFLLSKYQLESKNFLSQLRVAKMMVDVPQMVCILKPEQSQSVFTTQKVETTLEDNYFLQSICVMRIAIFLSLYTVNSQVQRGKILNSSTIWKISPQIRNVNLYYKHIDQIKTVLFSSWNYKSETTMEKQFSLSNRMIFVLKANMSEVRIVHYSYLTIKDQLRQHQVSGQGPQLNLDQDFIDQYFFPFDDYLFDRFRVTSQRDLEARNVFICLKEDNRVKKKPTDLSQAQSKKTSYYLIIVPQNNNAALEIGGENKSVVKQAILPLKFSFYLSKHLHLIKGNSYVTLFNQMVKSYVALQTCELFTLPDPSTVTKMSLDQLKHYKIEGTNEFREPRLFDVRPPCQHITTLDTLGSTNDLEYMTQLIHTSYEQDKIVQRIKIEKLHVMYLNPYIIVIENKTWLTVYSIYDPKYGYQIKLPQCKINSLKVIEFLSFVELNSGSMTISDNPHYRHCTCPFLTIDKNQYINFSVLHLPPIDTLTSKAKLQPEFRITTLTNDAVIDWRLQKDQKLIKVVAGQLFDTLNDIDSSLNNFIIFQLSDSIFLKDLSKPGIASQYETGQTEVPFISVNKLRGQYSGEHSYFFHCQRPDDPSQHQVKWLRLVSNSKGYETHLKQILHEKINYKTLKMEFLSGNFYFFDQNMTLKKYFLDEGRSKLLLQQESRLVDDARLIFEKFEPKCMQITQQGVFIGPSYFQALTQNEMKDANFGFEQQRNKFIHKFEFCSLLTGPILSQDRSRLLYIQFDDEDDDSYLRRSTTIKQSEPIKESSQYDKSQLDKQSEQPKSHVDKSELGRSQIENSFDVKRITQSQSHTIKSSVNQTVFDENDEIFERKQTAGFRRQSSKKFTINKKPSVKLGFAKQDEDKDDDSIIKLDNELDERIHMQSFELPLLNQQEVQYIHQDDYILEQVLYTQFTQNDDVLLILKNFKFLIFDLRGQPVNLIQKHELNFTNRNVKCIEVNILHSHQDDSKALGLVLQQRERMQKKVTNYVLLFTYNINTNTYTVQQKGLPQVIVLLQPNAFKLHSRLSEHGVLYTLYSDSQNNIKFLKGDENIDILEAKLSMYSVLLNQTEALKKYAKHEEDSKKLMTESLLSSSRASSEVDGTEDNLDFSGAKQPIFDVIQNHQKARLYRFEIVHDKWIVFSEASGLSIEYLEMDNLGANPKTVDINLREGKIHQILTTDNENHIQFVYEQRQPTYLRRNFLITWDLQRNQELYNLRLVYDKELEEEGRIHQVKITKGVTQNLNFYVPIKDNYIYDLRYDFPVNVFNGHTANSSSNYKKFKGDELYFTRREETTLLAEIKLASNQRALLGLSPEKLGTVQLSFNYMNLLYMEYVLTKFEQHSIQVNGELELNGILLQFCRFTLKEKSKRLGLGGGDNILHIMKDRAVFLKMFRKEVDSQSHQEGRRDLINFIYFSLLENDMQTSPLVMTIKSSQNKEVERFLKILLLNPEKDYFVYIRSYFFQLLDMQNPKFEKFLDKCSYNNIFNYKIHWYEEKDAVFHTTKTRYIENSFLEDNFGLKKEDFYRPRQTFERQTTQQRHDHEQSKIRTGFIGGLQRAWEYLGYAYDLVSGVDRRKYKSENKREGFDEPSNFVVTSKIETNKKNVTIKAYNFGWMLRGDYGRQFIKFLAKQKNDSSLFESEAVKAVIQTQWQWFKWQYMKYQFLPQCLYQIVLLAFFSHLNPDTWTEQFRSTLDPDRKSALKMTHNIIIDFVYFFAAYFIVLESNKAFRTRHISSFIPLLFDITVLINAALSNKYHGQDSRVAHPEAVRKVEFLNGITIIWSYFIFLMHFRVFETTGVLINVIFYIFKGTINYLIIFFLVNFGIGTSLYLLSMTQDPLTDYEKFSGANLFYNFIFAYKTSIGQQDSDTLENMTFFQPAFYFYYIVWTFVVAIVLTNLMIAMLNDIYSQMMAAQKTERYKAKCNLIWEDEFIFRRDKIFGKSKFILKAQLDEDPSARDQRDINVGIINTIVQRVRHSLVKDYDDTQRQFKMLEKKVKKNNEVNVETLNSVIQSLEQIKIQLSKKGEE